MTTVRILAIISLIQAAAGIAQGFADAVWLL